jgi:hypothetical protein
VISRAAGRVSRPRLSSRPSERGCLLEPTHPGPITLTGAPIESRTTQVEPSSHPGSAPESPRLRTTAQRA